MVLVEFRIPLPMTVKEFHVGQLYMTCKASVEASDGDKGMKWIKNEPFDNTDGTAPDSELSQFPIPKAKGQYTLKHYFLGDFVPGWILKFLPAGIEGLVEEAWNAYPYCVTVLTNGYLLKNKFKIVIESMHLPGPPSIENALSLSDNQVKVRQVKVVDIADDCSDPKNPKYKAELDLIQFKSEKTGRGPLVPGEWYQDASVDALMTCYKAVTANFVYWGAQTMAEGWIVNSQEWTLRDVSRMSFAWIDEWIELSIEDIRKMEEDNQKEMEILMKKNGLGNSDEAPTITT